MARPVDWHRLLIDGYEPLKKAQRVFRRLPSDPRCKLCQNPFGGVGGKIFGVIGRKPSRKNPNIWQTVLGWLLFVAIFGICASLALTMRLIDGLWRPEEYWIDVTDRYGRWIRIARWALRPGSVTGMDILGGSVLAIIYLANTYPIFVYDHGPQWLKGI